MAVASVTIDAVRVEDMDTAAGTSNFGGAGGAGAAESDFYYQLTSGTTGCFARKVGTTYGGFQVDLQTPAPVDMTAADRELWMCKVIATNSNALLAIGSPAMVAGIGSTSANYNLYDLAGFDQFYPKKGGWLVVPINVNESVYIDTSIQVGTPNLASADWVAVQCGFSGTSKAANVGMDSVDFGLGLNLVGGDSTDPDAVWEDFFTNDSGLATASYGFCQKQDGIFFLYGTNWIGRNASGTTVATEFTDTGKVVVFPDGLYSQGDPSMQIDLGNASTVVAMELCAFSGTGIGYRHLFNTEDDVNGTNETIGPVGVRSLFSKGDAVIARNQGGTETPGPSDGTTYYVGWDGSTAAGLIELHTARRAAMIGTGTPVGLTASTAGNGEVWRLDRTPDTRPEWIHTGTSGVATYTACSWTNYRAITATSVVTFDTCVFTDCENFTQSNAAITDCSVNDHSTLEGESFLLSDNPADISGTTFDNTGGFGHAIEINTTGTYVFDANVFTGYGPAGRSFHTQTDVDDVGEDITFTTHPWTTGDAVVYSDEGLSDTIGLTDNTVYYVRSIDANTVSLHINEGDAINNNALINLTDGAAGQTHYLYSANAAIWNNSGGLVTISVTNGAAPTIRNQSGSTTDVTVDVEVTFTGMKDNTEVRIYKTSDDSVVDGIENATAGSTDARTFAWTAAASLDVYYRLIFGGTAAGDGKFYENIEVRGFIVPGSATSIPIQQRVDRNYSNP